MSNRAGFGMPLAAVALMLGACTYSINPLSAPGDSEPDARLEGVWQVTSGDQSVIGYAYVVPLDNGVMDVDFVDYQYKKELGDSSPVEWDRLRVFRTEIDGAQYLNVMPVAGMLARRWERPVYFIYKYDISEDGVLTIWAPSAEALHTLHRDIEEGRLAGIKKPSNSTSQPSNSTSETSDSTSSWVSDLFSSLFSEWIVTASAADLREYVRQANDPFTQHRLTLRKILPKVPGALGGSPDQDAPPRPIQRPASEAMRPGGPGDRQALVPIPATDRLLARCIRAC